MIFSSREIVVSPPLVLVSIDFTVIVNVFGGGGAMRRDIGQRGVGDATFMYVHTLPTASGRTFTPQTSATLPPAAVLDGLFWTFGFAWAAAGTRVRASRASVDVRIGTRSYGTFGPG